MWQRDDRYSKGSKSSGNTDMDTTKVGTTTMITSNNTNNTLIVHKKVDVRTVIYFHQLFSFIPLCDCSILSDGHSSSAGVTNTTAATVAAKASRNTTPAQTAKPGVPVLVPLSASAVSVPALVLCAAAEIVSALYEIASADIALLQQPLITNNKLQVLLSFSAIFVLV
jgi:hypothetical protein